MKLNKRKLYDNSLGHLEDLTRRDDYDMLYSMLDTYLRVFTEGKIKMPPKPKGDYSTQDYRDKWWRIALDLMDKMRELNIVHEFNDDLASNEIVLSALYTYLTGWGGGA